MEEIISNSYSKKALSCIIYITNRNLAVKLAGLPSSLSICPSCVSFQQTSIIL